MSSYHKAKLIANQTSGIHEGVAKVMQLCTEIAEERDELKSQIHEITKLLNSWENGSDYEYFIATCDVGDNIRL